MASSKKYWFWILMIGFNTQALGALKESHHHYGLVLLFSKTIDTSLRSMTETIGEALQEICLPNTPHITLLHLNMDRPDAEQVLIKKIQEHLLLKPLRIRLRTFALITDASGDRWIDWNVEPNTLEYSKLIDYHEKMVKILTPLRTGALDRCTEDKVHQGLSPEQQDQIMHYGAFGLNTFEKNKKKHSFYRPHSTLFYFENRHHHDHIDLLLKTLARNHPPLDITCHQMALVELGYHGNIRRIIRTFDIQKKIIQRP